jgi:hypothetical protein
VKAQQGAKQSAKQGGKMLSLRRTLISLQARKHVAECC